MEIEGPDWHLREWFAATDHKQADLINQLGLQRNIAFKLWHGTQPYRRDYLNQVAEFLNIRPFELLMPPGEAMALRTVREQAVKLAAVAEPSISAAERPTLAARRLK